ncbi:hypothetical protein ABN034_14885 [Actinopolymorpha sp. B11F2]
MFLDHGHLFEALLGVRGVRFVVLHLLAPLHTQVSANLGARSVRIRW